MWFFCFFCGEIPFLQKSGLDALGGVIRFPKNGLVAKCAPEPRENRGRTVGEGQEPWENRGKAQRTVGEPWGLYKEPWENRGDFTKNRGRTVGTLQRTVGEPWGLYRGRTVGEPWENRGDSGSKKQ